MKALGEIRKPWQSVCAVFLLAAMTSGGAPDRGLAPVVPGPEGQRAFDDLAKYYRTEETPDYLTALDALFVRSGAEAAARQRAGDYIYALLVQLRADERNGRAVWRPLPWFSGGAVSLAREFRKELAKGSGLVAQTPEAVKAALWLVEEEELPDAPIHGVEVLLAIGGARTTEALERILKRPPPNEAALVTIVRSVADRKMTQLVPALADLCGHYRETVRTAARTALEELGAKEEPAEWVPEEAFTPWLMGALTNVTEMLLEPVPEGVQWVRFVYTDPDGDGEGEPAISSASGWLLNSNGTNYAVIDWFGQRQELPKSRTEISQRRLSDDAQQFVELRKKGSKEAKAALSWGGWHAWSSAPDFITVPEVLMAAWSYQAGDRRTAAALLFPQLAEMKDDRGLIWAARDLLGHHYHLAMINAFSTYRNYRKAIDLADHLSKPVFRGYAYQGRAVELAAQLRMRAGDFNELNLPTAARWKAKQREMSRREQIVYLADRMRLLNCFQWGQPGDVDYRDKQYSLPLSKRPWCESQSWEHTEVINPYNELMGMELTVPELPILVPYLADQDFMLTTSYGRGWSPHRVLHRVNWAIGGVLNTVAKRNLADLVSYYRMTPAQKKEHVESILQWCRENRDKNEEDLLLAALRRPAERREFNRYAAEAVDKKLYSALPILVSKYDRFEGARRSIVMFVYELNTPDAAPVARKWLKSKDEHVRFYSALILLKYGDKAKKEGLAELKDVLAYDHHEYWYSRAVDGLIDTGEEELITLACGILKEVGFNWRNAYGTMNHLFLTGRKECLDFLVSKLGSEKPSNPMAVLQGQEVSIEGDDCAELVSTWRTDGYRFDYRWPEGKKKEERAKLADWLREQRKLILAGKEHGVKVLPAKQEHLEWFPDHR